MTAPRDALPKVVQSRTAREEQKQKQLEAKQVATHHMERAMELMKQGAKSLLSDDDDDGEEEDGDDEVRITALLPHDAPIGHITSCLWRLHAGRG